MNHIGLYHNRVVNQNMADSLEAALAAYWRLANASSFFHGQIQNKPLLESLVPNYTQEQATACATVVQWLGTSVGLSFLESALDDVGYRLVKAKD